MKDKTQKKFTVELSAYDMMRIDQALQYLQDTTGKEYDDIIDKLKNAFVKDYIQKKEESR